MDIKVSKQAIHEAAEKLSNWGRWGEDDEIGTLNNVGPEEIVAAAKLIRTGKVFPLGLPLDVPIQTGLFGGRWNPIHTFLADGADAYSGNQDANRIQYADDAINMPIQASTHWDSLNHIYLDKTMYNGYDCRSVDSAGGTKNGIEHTRAKMIGRGVLLDVPRFKGVDWLEDGYGISNDELDACAAAQGVEIRKGDFVIFRTGQQERCLQSGDWTGYAGGDAPGVKFENCYWSKEKDIAGIASDTWGVEVRPNETDEANQPWHWVVIPKLGLTMGEIFYLKELAADCAADGVSEFFFAAPPLHLPGGTGSPLNPHAVK
jgi:kynurenine formamidase